MYVHVDERLHILQMAGVVGFDSKEGKGERERTEAKGKGLAGVQKGAMPGSGPEGNQPEGGSENEMGPGAQRSVAVGSTQIAGRTQSAAGLQGQAVARAGASQVGRPRQAGGQRRVYAEAAGR